ncbi:hypothetical protein [Plastoroseomonas hellenica]|uniref:Transcriptional regulator n=1 Tax=Plastoroseomonas hellenica TaxID=2687306 RepID=A0ABS5ES03_9PROT|nr:hypothetical protein [Plastoroseomonas hellenica]MBR0641944.1 hypothetical protein [Plastoroseomonas hellenica]MBR0663072.1 hypothetical protein [Plastoroseomonas hellenica]
MAPWPGTVSTAEGYYLLSAEEKAGLPKHKAFLTWIRDCVDGPAGG